MKFAIAIGLVGILGLSACAVPSQDAPTIGDSALRNELDQQIAQSGAEAAAALRQVAAVQRARTPAPSPAVADRDLPPDLRVKTDFEWSGPAEPLVKTLAGRIGYAFRQSGNPPAIPPIVNISLRQTSFGQAFADIGLQVQSSATIIVDPSAKVVEIRYEAARAPVSTFRELGTRTPLRSSAHRVRHSLTVPGK